MKITKQGETGETLFEGRCSECECEFECRKDETVPGIIEGRFVRCPNCHEEVYVHRLTTLRKMARKQESDA